MHEAVFTHVGPWTEDDYFALPDVPAKVELVDGALLVPTLTSIAHQRLIFEVTKLLAESCADPRWEALPGANVGSGRITFAGQTCSWSGPGWTG